jgi:hypothetical protein
MVIVGEKVADVAVVDAPSRVRTNGAATLPQDPGHGFVPDQNPAGRLPRLHRQRSRCSSNFDTLVFVISFRDARCTANAQVKLAPPSTRMVWPVT